MKKQISLIIFILFAGLSQLHAQPVTGIRAVDMKTLKSKGIEFSITRDKDELVVTAKGIESFCDPRDTLYCFAARVKFIGNNRKQFEAYAGIQPESELTLEVVDETGKTVGASINGRDNFNVMTHELGHTLGIKLNGKLIGTGYKPKN